VAKPQDETSRHPVTGESASATPVPVPVPADDDGQSDKRKDGARRPRAGIPRERSGPIGIASGDFATPTVRKRTTTQPRLTPVAGVPVQQPITPIVVGPAREMPAKTPDPAPMPAKTPGPVATLAKTPGPAAVPDPAAMASPPPATPPPERTGETLGATPVDLVDAVSAGSLPPPLPTDNPFAGSDLDTEAAVLAAEAAAVRALDSGPLTPPPELNIAGPTPPPATAAVEDQPTPPPVAASPTPPPLGAVPSAAPTPPPLAVEALAPASGEIDVPESRSPELPVHVPPAVEVAAVAEAAIPELPVEGALPESPMASEGSSASSDLAHPVDETPAPAAPDLSVEADVEGVDEVEVEESPETDGVAAGADGVRVATGRAPTPPPIPGSFVKPAGADARPPTPPPVPDVAPLLPALPILPEPLSQRPRRPKRSKPWFEEVFDEDYLRTLPFLRPDQTVRDVEFIAASLSCPAGGELLDVGCGYGRHAIELVQQGYNVTGLDLSLPLLIRAADEAQKRALSVNFVHADMREMAFEQQFDGAYSMLTSFGYFDEETNLRVAERICRALKPKARLLLEIVNRDYVVGDLPVRVWWEGTGCVVLEEVDFNFHTSRINTHRSIVFDDGRQLEQELSIRAYSLHEIGRLLRQAGFRVTDVSGHLATRGDFFGSASRNLLVLAEKREDGEP